MTAPPQEHFAVLVPVGPDPAEPGRLEDTLASVRAYEPADRIALVVVDDSPRPRDLPIGTGWRSSTVIRTTAWASPRPPNIYDAMTEGTLTGLATSAASHPAFTLKLDTDALVFAPFADAVMREFRSDPALAVVGSYTRTCRGQVRDFSSWEQHLERCAQPIVWRRSRPRLNRRFRAMRALIHDARSHGHPIGGHCLGGAYAVGPAMLQRPGLFESSVWRGQEVSEDVAVGLLAGAAGLRLGNLTAAGEVFALAHIGLPSPPAAMVDAGYAITHSLKNTPTQSEAELRAWFRQRREAAVEDDESSEPTRALG